MKLDETMLTKYDRERIERYALINAKQLIHEVKVVRVRLMKQDIRNN